MTTWVPSLKELASGSPSVSVFTARHLANFGALPTVRFAETSRMRFRSEDVESFLESRRRHEEAVS